METTSTAFFYISKNLEEEILGGYINSVQTIDKGVWKIKIHRKKTKQLIVSPDICFLTNYAIPVTDIAGFERYLKKKLYNQKIHQIFQHKNNRLICFKLDNLYLIFEFFSNSNIILTDNEFKIITSKQKEEWKDRIIKKGETYIFPQGEDIKELSEENVGQEFSNKTESEIISTLAKKYNIAPFESKEILKDYSVKDIKKIYDYKNPLLVFREANNKEIVTVREDEEKNIFENIEKKYLEKYKERQTEQKNTKKERIKHVLKEQEKTIEKFEDKINSLETEAQLIYSYFTYIDQINTQTEKALKQKINKEEIIQKINGYLSKSKLPLKIKSINQKKKTYEIEINN